MELSELKHKKVRKMAKNGFDPRTACDIWNNYYQIKPLNYICSITRTRERNSLGSLMFIITCATVIRVQRSLTSCRTSPNADHCSSKSCKHRSHTFMPFYRASYRVRTI